MASDRMRVKRIVERILQTNDDKFISIKALTKKNPTVENPRVFVTRSGIKKGLKTESTPYGTRDKATGKFRKKPQTKDDLIYFYDLQVHGWRCIKPENIVSITADGEIHSFMHTNELV